MKTVCLDINSITILSEEHGPDHLYIYIENIPSQLLDTPMFCLKTILPKDTGVQFVKKHFAGIKYTHKKV